MHPFALGLSVTRLGSIIARGVGGAAARQTKAIMPDQPEGWPA
jgi:hypothetical protein